MEAVTDSLPGGRGAASGSNRALASRVFPFVRAWWSMLGAAPVSVPARTNHPAIAAVTTVPLLDHDSRLSPADPASSGSLTPDFEHILASIVRASILSALPSTASGPVTAPKLGPNPRAVDFGGDDSVDVPSESRTGGSTAAPSAWRDSCPLAAPSWLADLSSIDAGKELAVVRRYLLKVLPDIVSVDETAAAALVLDLLGADQAAEVIPALDKFPRLQVSGRLWRGGGSTYCSSSAIPPAAVRLPDVLFTPLWNAR